MTLLILAGRIVEQRKFMFIEIWVRVITASKSLGSRRHNDYAAAWKYAEQDFSSANDELICERFLEISW